MKRIYGIAALAGLFALGAAAQDPAQLDKMKVEMQQMLSNLKVNLVGGIMGPAVKGAPYSGEEVRETTQILGDGTRIHNEARTLVFRDNEGRVRQETPTQISISDPVANVRYLLDPKTQTARKMSMGTAVPVMYKFAGGGSAQGTVGYSVTMNSEGGVATERAMEEAKAKAEGAFIVRGGGGAVGRGGTAMVRKSLAKRETLGTQIIEGINSEGIRETSTLEAGAIGNDRPIQTATESWYSKDLQTNILTKHTDPRTGEEVVRIINIRRGDPGLNMFQVPSGYTIVDQK